MDAISIPGSAGAVMGGMKIEGSSGLKVSLEVFLSLIPDSSDSYRFMGSATALDFAIATQNQFVGVCVEELHLRQLGR